ncbi:hypothetical protein BWK59_11385 [Flavobacterium davisii]|uniref:Glycosyltransferase family 1 protein n=2 Tax=Flavobacterium TaxID=237 RepID=A0A246GIA2_9FLAO|nr:hypothetical protein [Flavobacterium davisii]OWP83273.1 hypothetical protein BWK59_11385 [Flavobacterium davisii]
MKNKKIILAITSDVKLYECFIKNLEFHNYEVQLICATGSSKYPSLGHKIYSFLRKIFLNDRNYKKKISQIYNSKLYLEQIKNLDQSNAAIFIRPDLFTIEIINITKEKTNKIIAYQWDGLNRFPNVKELIPLFDRFYIFQKKDQDLYNHKYYPITNFYFDCYQNEIFKNSVIEYDLFYIGSYDDRINHLLEICDFLDKKGLKLKILLRTKKKKNLKKYSFIEFFKNPLSYKENLELVAKSRILLDIHHTNIHDGLSFRIFEAIGYNKKIISTNVKIKEYDIYCSNNVFCFENNFNDLNNFINTNIENYPSELKNKYSFKNWIEYILEEPNAIPIHNH